MTEYIDRTALLGRLPDEPYKGVLHRVLMQAPVADVAPVVHGRWLDEDFPENEATVHGFAVCSVCGELSHKAEHGYNILSTYCPNCGAKMRCDNEQE